jgi:hypothetical protein
MIHCVQDPEEKEVEFDQSSSTSKASERLRSYLTTLRKSKVHNIATKFDIITFSHSNEERFIMEKDSEDNLVLHNDEEHRKINIKGGTAEKLIQKLADPSATGTILSIVYHELKLNSLKI